MKTPTARTRMCISHYDSVSGTNDGYDVVEVIGLNGKLLFRSVYDRLTDDEVERLSEEYCVTTIDEVVEYLE